MDIEVPDCPFCGGHGEVDEDRNEYGMVWKVVRCQDCSACADFDDWMKRVKGHSDNGSPAD